MNYIILRYFYFCKQERKVKCNQKDPKEITKYFKSENQFQNKEKELFKREKKFIKKELKVIKEERDILKKEEELSKREEVIQKKEEFLKRVKEAFQKEKNNVKDIRIIESEIKLCGKDVINKRKKVHKFMEKKRTKW